MPGVSAKATLTFSAFSAALVGFIAHELTSSHTDAADMGAPSYLNEATYSRTSANHFSPDPGRIRKLAQIALDRPLFVENRRPVTIQISSAGSTLSLPRLTGVIATPTSRRALFVVADERPLALQEGAQIGAYTVQAITAGAVTVSGPEGLQIIRPTLNSAVPKEVMSKPIITESSVAQVATTRQSSYRRFGQTTGIPSLFPGANLKTSR